MEDDAILLVRQIKERISGIGPGFIVHVGAKPGEWKALLDCIPGPVEEHASFEKD